MSRMQIWYRCHEGIIEEDGGEKYYEYSLPHADEISKAMPKNWNEANMEQYFDGILAGKIESCPMTFRICNKPEGLEACAVITVIGKTGVRFTEKIRNEIDEQIGTQLCDGWGEGFFGYANIMTAPDGTRYYVE